MSQISALTAIFSKVMMKTMAKKKKFAYKYMITYEVIEVPDAPNVKERISVRREQYATNGRIKEKHLLETARADRRHAAAMERDDAPEV